jgi:predicted phosphodiesterase
MQIQLISDIHLEFPRNYEKFMDTFELKGDLLVIAGDACNLKKPDPLWNFLAKIQKKVDHILYVPGNHEYYGSSADTIKSHETLNEIYQGNCRIMNNSHIRIGKVNFYLSTLWTDPTEYAAQRLNDFYTIKGRMDEYFKGTRIIRNPFGYSHIGESYDYKEFVIDIK